MFEKELSKSLGGFTSGVFEFEESAEGEIEVVDVEEVEEKALGDGLVDDIEVEEDKDSGDNMDSELETSKMFAKSLFASLDRFEGGK